MKSIIIQSIVFLFISLSFNCRAGFITHTGNYKTVNNRCYEETLANGSIKWEEFDCLTTFREHKLIKDILFELNVFKNNVSKKAYQMMTESALAQIERLNTLGSLNIHLSMNLIDEIIAEWKSVVSEAQKKYPNDGQSQ